MVAKGDTATLRQNAIPGVAADFSGIEKQLRLIKGSGGGRMPPRASLVLEAEGGRTCRACGIFLRRVSERVGRLPLVPPFTSTICLRKYAVLILDASTAKGPTAVSSF